MNLKGNWPEGFEAWKHLSDVVLGAGLEPRLLNLDMTRASQINGCGPCLDMHTTDAVSAGEDPRRLHILPASRDVSWFSARERAAALTVNG